MNNDELKKKISDIIQKARNDFGEIREQARLRRDTPKEVLDLLSVSVPQLTEGR